MCSLLSICRLGIMEKLQTCNLKSLLPGSLIFPSIFLNSFCTAAPLPIPLVCCPPPRRSHPCPPAGASPGPLGAPPAPAPPLAARSLRSPSPAPLRLRAPGSGASGTQRPELSPGAGPRASGGGGPRLGLVPQLRSRPQPRGSPAPGLV